MDKIFTKTTELNVNGTVYIVHHDTDEILPLVGTDPKHYLVIPHIFYKITKKSNGKSYRLAAEILGYLYTWYKGTTIQRTKSKVEIKQSFKGQQLYIDYKKLEAIFCTSDTELRAAFAFLKKLELAEINYKPVIGQGSITWANLNTEKIASLFKNLETETLPCPDIYRPSVNTNLESSVQIYLDSESRYTQTHDININNINISNNISNKEYNIENEKTERLSEVSQIETSVNKLDNVSSSDYCSMRLTGSSKNNSAVLKIPGFDKKLVAEKSSLTSESKSNIMADMEDIEKVRQIKNKYPSNRENRYTKRFSRQIVEQFYKSIASRVKQKKFTLEAFEDACKNFITVKNYSLMDLLQLLKNSKYSDYDILMDFAWIMCAGKVSGPKIEGKGARLLESWISAETTSLAEIEDCWIWMVDGSISYRTSLTSVPAALKMFEQYKKATDYGRYEFYLEKAATAQQKKKKTVSNIDFTKLETDISTVNIKPVEKEETFW